MARETQALPGKIFGLAECGGRGRLDIGGRGTTVGAMKTGAGFPEPKLAAPA
jgi:hypothetical protein